MPVPPQSAVVVEPASTWTVDMLYAFMQRQIDDQQASFLRQLGNLRTMLDERYQTQTKAVDAAFASQQTAMHTAFTAAERALDQRASASEREFHEHLTQYRHEVSLAFESSDRAIQKAFEASDKAISKAEIATEKRFDSVNEFRAQLADQAARFMPRTEAEGAINRNIQRLEEMASFYQTLMTRVEYNAAHERLVEQVRDLNERTNTYALRSDVTTLTDRMNRSEGKGTGLNDAWIYFLGAVALISTVVSIFLAVKA